MRNLIKTRLQESLTMELIESLIDEDYPSTFDMGLFKTLKKFSERVKYCEEHLKRISSGSSRIVYMIDNEKVLKLAKNEKGVAQCETEIQWGQDRYYGEILAKTLDSHPDGLWVEMELARKLKKHDFLRLDNIDFEVFARYLKNVELENKGQRPIYNIADVYLEVFHESQFANTLISFMHDSDSPAGDFMKGSSYGVVMRDGHETIVLIDFGLTGDIYSTYYDVSR